MLRQPQDSLQQPQRKMLQLVVLMLLACAAAATHPVSLHCAELPPLPLLSFLPSSLLSSLLPLLARTSHAVLYRAQWGSYRRAPSFNLSNVLLFLLLHLCRQNILLYKMLFLHSSCFLSCMHEAQKMRALKLWNAFRLFFSLTSCLSLTMVFQWHLPPGSRWEKKKSSERNEGLLNGNGYHLLSNTQCMECFFICGIMLCTAWALV